MQKMLLCVLPLVLVTFSANGAPTDHASKVLDRFVLAYNKADADGLASLFSAESQFVGLQSRKLLLTPTQIRSYFGPLIKLKYQIRFDNLVMTAPAENVVLASVTESYVARRKNKDIKIETRTTFTILKVNQDWKIVSYHKSPQPED